MNDDVNEETVQLVTPFDEVTVHYSLKSADGEVLESTVGEEPVTFEIGKGFWPQTLENTLCELEVGRQYVFVLDAENAFGEPDPTLVQEVPRASFTDMEPQVGSLIEFTDEEGHALPGWIKAVDAETVIVDFNHPLSGCPVVFEVKVLAARLAPD